MPDLLLATKISLPILRHVLVPRKQVLRQLEGEQDGHFLTLLSAPAGYGKTATPVCESRKHEIIMRFDDYCLP